MGLNAACRTFHVGKNSIKRWLSRLGGLKESLLLYALCHQFIQLLVEGDELYTKKSVIERVGLFDEHPSLRTAEDGEWAYRALRCGVPIIYAPEIVVRHYGWRDEGKREMQHRDYARSHGGFYGKYMRKVDWFIALRALIHHVRALRQWLRGIVTGDQELATYGHAYLTGLLPGIIAGCRKGKAS